MIYYVDIDETICTRPEGSDYNACVPMEERIKVINGLFDQGHTVVYWTARGGNSGIDWTELTERQLNMWGCKHNRIEMRKPSYDVFIDDKAIKSDEFFK